MHVDAVPSKQLEGALRHTRSEDDLTSSSPASSSVTSSAERSPHTELAAVNCGPVSTTGGCEYDDTDCWSQEDDDIIQVNTSTLAGLQQCSTDCRLVISLSDFFCC